MKQLVPIILIVVTLGLLTQALPVLAGVSGLAPPETESPPPEEKSDLTGCGGWFGWVHPTCLAAWGFNFIIRLLGYLLAFVAWLFDLVLSLTVVKFKTLVEEMRGIEIGWKMVRDFANILFIFILLYIAIGVILRVQQMGGKQLVIRVIIYALLINFSLVVTRTIIDSGNVLAAFFWQQAGGTGETGLSNRLVGALKIQTVTGLTGGANFEGGLYNAVETNAPAASQDVLTAIEERETEFSQLEGKKPPNPGFFTVIVGGFGAIVFILLTILVLGAAMLFFVARAVILIFLMVVSPFAFVFAVFPKAGGLASSWWSKLFSQTFFAPIYLGILWLVITIVTKTKEFSSNVLGSAGKGGSFEFFGATFFFMIIIGLLFAALIAAARFGAYGGAAAERLGKSWGKSLGRATYNRTVAGALRTTLGRTAFNIGQSEKVRAFAARVPGGGLMIKGLDAAASTSFGAKMGAMKGGYQKARKQKIEAAEKMAKRLGKDERTGEVSPEIMKTYGERYGKWRERLLPTLAPQEVPKAVRKKVEKAYEAAEYKAGFYPGITPEERQRRKDLKDVMKEIWKNSLIELREEMVRQGEIVGDPNKSTEERRKAAKELARLERDERGLLKKLGVKEEKEEKEKEEKEEKGGGEGKEK